MLSFVFIFRIILVYFVPKNLIYNMIYSENFGDTSQDKDDNIDMAQALNTKNIITYNDLMGDNIDTPQALHTKDFEFEISQEIQEEPIVEILVPEPQEQKKQPQSEEIAEFLVPELQEQEKQPQSEDNQNMKNQKKRTTFHNCQKHIVTSIRTIIDVLKFGKEEETAQCQKKIWKIFMKSNKINKTLVSLVVGDLTEQQTSQINLYGFRSVIKQFAPHIIKKSQQNIREEVISQLRSINFEEGLIKRRMKHKEQFIVYFKAFLQELLKGELDKRMAKCTVLLKNQQM